MRWRSLGAASLKATWLPSAPGQVVLSGVRSGLELALLAVAEGHGGDLRSSRALELLGADPKSSLALKSS